MTARIAHIRNQHPRPLGQDGRGVDLTAFDYSTFLDFGAMPANVKPMTEETQTKDREALMRSRPRSRMELLKHYHGQPAEPSRNSPLHMPTHE